MSIFSTKKIKAGLYQTDTKFPHISLDEHRRFLRIHAHVSVLYRLVEDEAETTKSGKKTKSSKTGQNLATKNLDYRQASTLDISAGGVSLLLNGTSDELRVKLQKPNQRIQIRMSLLKQDEPVEFNGIIRRFYTVEDGKMPLDVIGVKYDDIDTTNRGMILAYLDANRRRKRNKRIMFAFIGATIIALGVLMQIQIDRLKIKSKLVRTEEDKKILEIQIDDLLKRKDTLDKILDRNNKTLKEQNEKLTQKDADLTAKENLIVKYNQDMQQLEKLLESAKLSQKQILEETQRARAMKDNFEKEMYKHLVINDKSPIELNSLVDVNFINSKIYPDLINAQKANNRPRELQLAQQGVAQFKDSEWAHIVLARAYFYNNDRKASWEVFQTYLNMVAKRLKI